MFPLLDNRYLYKGVNDWLKAMEYPARGLRFAADLFDERVTKPLNPMLHKEFPFLQHMQRALAVRLRLGQRLIQSYNKPAFGITDTTIGMRSVAVEETVVLSMPFCRLLHFKQEGNHRKPRLLMIAPMAGHYATLLRDTVRDSLPYFDVYITDWVNAREVPISEGAFDMDSYIATLIRCFEQLGSDFHVLSICQSGVPAYAAVCLLESKNRTDLLPTTVTLMGSPIDVRKSPTAVNAYASEHDEGWLEQVALSIVPEGYPGSRRLVYPGFMQLAAFLSMNPERHQKSITDGMRHYIDGDFESEEKISSFYAEYCSVMDLTAEFYLQTIKVVFQEALLPRGLMQSRGRKVDPHAIKRTAIFAVEGEFDDICGIGQTKAALSLASHLPASKKSHLLLEGAGHYGLFNGHRFREIVLPALREFVTAHGVSTAHVAAA